ncbi:MAG: tryptophan synthase alpha chain [Acidobacteriaceae bacterium]|jgi:tryptophan synthase alpha chain
MPNRIENCFKRLRGEKRRGFIPYICAGDPTLQQTVELSLALEKAGADILELGLPFSDPLADGIVNQLAAQRALSAGASVRGVLDCVREIRKKSQIPIVLYTYMNPLFQFGWDKFHDEASSAGVDGLLILDLPPEEDTAVTATGLIHIRLIAPTTPPDRMARIARTAKGFIYYVSREGVTGARDGLAESLSERTNELRKLSSLPIAVGFGISTPDQAREVAQKADAVVVGSAIVAQVAEHGAKPDLIERVVAVVRPMVEAVKEVR